MPSGWMGIAGPEGPQNSNLRFYLEIGLVNGGAGRPQWLAPGSISSATATRRPSPARML